MPTYEQKLEDAIVAAHEAGDTEAAQTLANELKAWKPKRAESAVSETFDPSEGMSRTDKFLAGAGKGMTDLARGAGQMMGMVSDADIAEARRLDDPLMGSGYAQAGNIVGQAAALAPAALIPGANTYAGAALIGAGAGAAQPVSGNESRLANTALGAAGGAAGQKLGNMAVNAIGKRTANAAFQKSQNAVRDATLKDVQSAGYQVPRSLYDPKFLSNRMESLAGKAAVKQQAAINNQQKTNLLARKYLGLQQDTPLDKSTIDVLLDTHAAPYRDASRLPAGIVGKASSKSLSTGKTSTAPVYKSGAELVEAIKEARDVSRSSWRSFNSGMAQNPTKARKSAVRADKLVETLENELDTLAQNSGAPDLLNNLRNARVNIAKVHSINNALNEQTGDVSARVLMRIGKKSKLTDEAKTIANFAEAFPQVAQEGVKVPAAGISKVEAMAAALLSGGGGAAFGFPGMAAGGLAIAPHMVRPFVLNGGVPAYGGAMLNLANSAAPAIPMLGTVGGGLLGANY